MELGVHLPLIAFDGQAPSLRALRRYTAAARDLGFTYLAVSDHLVFSRPWLDAPTALGAVLDQTGTMRIATTVALPVVRGPASAAKWFAAVDRLSGGRLVAGVGPGSSPRDYALAGVPWDERWSRLDDAVALMRALWRGETYGGSHYRTDGSDFVATARIGGPPVWIGSWGSAAGLRRVARIADGWIASAYHTTPARFAADWAALGDRLDALGRDGERFRNALATTWTYITDDELEAERVLRCVLAPALGRSADELRERVLIGPAEMCAERLGAFARAGVQRALLWPVADPIEQLALIRDRVTPLLEEHAGRATATV